MNGAGARTKGCVAEREVAALLQEWWQPVEPGAQFCRTPSSGGWGTPALRGGFKVAGDLATTATRFPWTVEVKRRESFKDAPLLGGQKSPVWGWWAQATAAAAEEQRWPMLWLRRSREPWRVMLPRNLVKLPAIVWSRYPGAVLYHPMLVPWDELRAIEPGRFVRSPASVTVP